MIRGHGIVYFILNYFSFCTHYFRMRVKYMLYIARYHSMSALYRTVVNCTDTVL